MVAKGLFVSGSTANNTRYAWRYAAAFALAATPPFNLDAVWHANITRSALSARVDVSINMESFLRAGQRPLHIVDLPADPRETELREACYARQGMRLGPSWEAGYWYRQLTEEWAL